MIEINYQQANYFIKNFLKKNFQEDSSISSSDFTIIKIAGDASFRSYYRVKLNNNNQTYILSFSPPNYEKIDHFIMIDNFLCINGFSAPKIFDIDDKNGFLLLEDFGDLTFTRLLENDNKNELRYYQNACDVLIELNKTQPDSSLKPYNNQILINEVMLFVEWYLKLIQKTINLDQIEQFKKIWFDLFDQLSDQKKVVVLRDYHADNLMIINNNNNYKSIGILDFQDALIGLPAYDLVSLLDDIRRNIDDKNRDYLYQYFVEKLQLDKQKFFQDCEILSLQRNIKILGIFARLVLRDNKKKYLDYLDRVKYFVNLRINSNVIFEPLNKLLNNYL